MESAFATLRRGLRLAACLALVLAASGVYAERNFSAWRPPSAKAIQPAVLQLPAGGSAVVRVAPLDRAEVDAMRAGNANNGLRALRLGKVREIIAQPRARSGALLWFAVPGGHAAHWQVVADGALALRVQLSVQHADAGVVARFASAGSTPVEVFESRVPPAGNVWSPVLGGDRATVELFAPEPLAPSTISITVAAVAPQFVDPRNARMADAAAKSSSAGSCQVDLACIGASDDALVRTASAVSRVTYVSDGYVWACTGTLLNPADGSFIPYYYTAAHCIHDAETAASVATLWFYESGSCGGGALAAQQLGGGARLLVADPTLDGALLMLNEMPPEGAVYAGWDSLPPRAGDAIAGIHHPGSGPKKVSLGTGRDYPDQRFLSAAWTIGATANGSSGSAVFTSIRAPRPDYLVRGALVGGDSACAGTVPVGTDVYSRFDLMWPKLARYLSANDAGGNHTGLWWNPEEPGWGIHIEHQAGVMIATLFGYDAGGRPRWYVASSLRERTDGDFEGELFESTGPPFDASPGGRTTFRTAGAMRIVFAGKGAARLAFEIDGQRTEKDIEPMAFAPPGPPACSLSDDVVGEGSNHQGLWWDPAEPGWGLALAQQGETVFGVIFTFDDGGRPLWLSASDLRRGAGDSFGGALYETSGSPFGARAWRPASIAPAGSVEIVFAGGRSAMLAYDIGGRGVRKSIARFVASDSIPVCQ